MTAEVSNEAYIAGALLIDGEQVVQAIRGIVSRNDFHVEVYTDLKKLNARILNRLIEKIIVHQRGVDEDGCLFQQIEIYYRFIGKTDIDLFDILCPAA